MHFHHSTGWANLRALIGGELLSPGPFSAKDLQNPQLALLDRHGIQCLWFSTQVWSGNRFGPYVLQYDETDLALPSLLELDDHHGARCFLSVPPLLADWLGAALDITPVPAAPDVWRRTVKEDRVDLLVVWKVPVSHRLHVVAGKTGRLIEDDANFARARLLAHVLLTEDPRFNVSLTADFGPAEAASNLLQRITAAPRGRSPDSPLTTACGAPEQLLAAALQGLVDADLSAAREAAIGIGHVADVAVVLAGVFNGLFGSNLSGADIENAG